MAWNRQSSDAKFTSHRAGHGASPKILVACGVVLIVAVGLTLYFYNGTVRQVRQSVTPDKKSQTIKAVECAKAKTVDQPDQPVKEPFTNKKGADYWRDKIYRDENGIARYPGGLQYMAPTDKVHRDTRVKAPRRFKHKCSEQIASLLELTPGEFVVGKIHFPLNFNDDLIASLNDPEKISPDDNADLADLKAAVEDVKKELLERMKNGEDPRKICMDTWDEIGKASTYRYELHRQLVEIRKNPKMTERDYADAVTAANMMMSEKGYTGFKLTPFQLKLTQKRDEQRLNNMTK